MNPCFFLIALLLPMIATAHDADAYGGLYRSRDAGATWLPADAGLYINASNALAVSPVDSNDLLYGTDTKLMRSKNGGRDWHDQRMAMPGPIFSVAFDQQSNISFAANATQLFRSDDGKNWRAIDVPLTAFPVAQIVVKNSDVYLAGNDGLYIGNLRGEEWSGPTKGLPEEAVTTLLLADAKPQATIHAVVGGRIWRSLDRGNTWQQAIGEWRDQRVDSIAADPNDPKVLWAAGASRIFRSADSGASWQPHGKGLPDPNILIRAIAVSQGGNTFVLSTHRGLMRSADGGETWAKVEGALPLHIEPGPLVQDHRDPNVLYAGYSLRPYGEAWRAAQQAAEQQRSSAALRRVAMIAAALVLISIATLVIWRRRGVRPSVAREQSPS